MKRQAISYIKPAGELAEGDRILTSRMTLAEVRSVESFDDTTGRACVAVALCDGAHATAAHYLAGETVLVLE